MVEQPVLMHDDRFIVTNTVGGKTLQEIADMSWTERREHMRTYVHRTWGRDNPSKHKTLYHVCVEWREHEYRTIEAEDENDLEAQLDDEYGHYDDYEYDIREETPCK